MEEPENRQAAREVRRTPGRFPDARDEVERKAHTFRPDAPARRRSTAAGPNC